MKKASEATQTLRTGCSIINIISVC